MPKNWSDISGSMAIDPTMPCGMCMKPLTDGGIGYELNFDKPTYSSLTGATGTHGYIAVHEKCAEPFRKAYDAMQRGDISKALRIMRKTRDA